MKNKKLNIALICGGRSGEHEVSLLSAKSIYEALDKKKYNVFIIGIDKKGHWRLGENSDILLNSKNPKLIKLDNEAAEVRTTVKGEKVALKILKQKEPTSSIDVVFPIMHGTYGEDGVIQGFLELMNVAYVGAGVLGSAIGMDKDVMKRLLRESNIKTAQYICIREYELKNLGLDKIIEQLKLPLFVKPANLGSSVGISKAKTKAELETAINYAFEFDKKIIIEEFIEGREIEISVLGNENPKASVAGEIIPNHEFYSYEAKYLDENGALLQIPAKLKPEQLEEIQNAAIKAFQILECLGMARVDFFLKENGEVYLNEINTIPGFTKISMYPKLWEATGLNYSELLDELINLAIQNHTSKNQLKRER